MDLDKKPTSAREHKYIYTLHMELSMLRSHSHNGHIYTVHMCSVEYYVSSSMTHNKMSPFTQLQMHWHKNRSKYTLIMKYMRDTRVCYSISVFSNQIKSNPIN